MGVKVIAEGVESWKQVDFLRHHNCDEIQGYFYSKPLPASSLKKMISDFAWTISRINLLPSA